MYNPQWLKQTKERRIIPYDEEFIKKSLKKSKKVIEEGLEEFKERGFSLGDVVRIGARMMLQVAAEEEVTAFLEKDYYVRGGRGNRNGYKPRVIKVGHGDILR